MIFYVLLISFMTTGTPKPTLEVSCRRGKFNNTPKARMIALGERDANVGKNREKIKKPALR
jgi:hypothetical protein